MNTRQIDPERALKVRAMLDLMTKLAREDAGAFFELVMRSERPVRPMRLAEHQKVALSFLLHPTHRRAVLMMSVRHSKSSLAIAITLWLLGRDPTLRGAIVSATQEQASKLLGAVSDYVQSSPELRMVFPDLRPSRRSREPWTQTSITVDRPMGIRDPSLKAIGIDGAIQGSRLDWIVVDDVLSRENTATDEGRRKVIEFLDNSVLSRLEPGHAARILCIGTPYHPKDALYEMERRGWATMRMSIDGTIRVCDDAEEILAARERGEPYEHWDHDGVRPRSANPRDEVLRLAAHDGDSPLWPEVFPPREVERLRRTTVLPEFNRMWMVDARADDEAMCKVEYVEACKEAARRAGVHSFAQQWPPEGRDNRLLNVDMTASMVFTGVDLAVGLGEQHDLTAFFTFAVLPDGRRQILDIESGRFTGPVIVDKIIDKHRRFGSVVVVENVAAQHYILQFTNQKAISVPVRPYSTNAMAKANPIYGVASLFVELQAGAWLIPNDQHGRVNKEVEAFIQACLDYVPDRHVEDVLMAQFVAREQARKWGCLTGGDLAGAVFDAGGFAAGLTAR